MAEVTEGPFIVVQNGVPRVESELRPWVPTRDAIAARFWEHLHAFGPAARYRPDVSTAAEPGFLGRPFDDGLLNARRDVYWRWSTDGPYELGAIASLIRSRLETDGHILRQWFGAEDVLKLLHVADSHAKMVLAVHAIRGHHNLDAAVHRFAIDALTRADRRQS
jgi:hypothetical protein